MKLFVGAKGLIVHEGKVLILREAAYDEGTNEGKWDLPGGRIQPEEPILAGLVREVGEESGLMVTPGDVIGVHETFPTIKGEECHIVRVYYKCVPESLEVTLSKDHDMYEWFDFSSGNEREFVSGVREMIERTI